MTCAPAVTRTGPVVAIGTSSTRTRALGGVKKAWEETGTNAIVLTEIDYADILRERAGTGESASWDRILSAMKDDSTDEGGSGGSIGEHPTMQDMMALTEDPERLAQVERHVSRFRQLCNPR